VTTFPRIVGSAWASSRLQWAELTAAYGAGDVIEMLARGIAALVVLLPPLAMAVALARLARRVVRTIWTRTEGKPVRRCLALLAVAALVAGLVWSWWPTPGRYRPVQAYEGGTLADVLPRARPAAGLGVGTQGRAAMYLPAGQAAPTRDHPILALVLVPHGNGPSPQPSAATVGDTGSGAPPGTWVFPIDRPLAPGEGDNQALAVNTTDGTVTYDVAFALVWEDGRGTVDNTNEAYALASCKDCAAVAVAFQVVLVTGQADVAVPQNVSVALSSNCVDCLTYSLAVQLFVTLDHPLSADAAAQLDRLWQQITAFGAQLQDVPLDQIQAQLSDYESQILAITQVDPATDGGPSVSPYPSDSPSPSSSPSATATGVVVTPSSTPSATAGDSPGASDGASSSPSPVTGTSSDAAEPTATPTSAASTADVASSSPS
jgi:putative peptide zinc metalloprotease protein